MDTLAIRRLRVLPVPRGAGLPEAFLANLRRALAHHGTTSLDPTPELRDALVRLFRSRERGDELAAAVARRCPDVLSNAVDPGWVPTRMGGPSAPDDLRLGHLTHEWLATSDAPEALTSGGYWHHQRREQPHAAVNDTRFHDRTRPARAHQALRE